MNKYIKISLAVLILAGGVYCIFEKEYGWGFFLVFLSIIPVFLYFKNEFLLLTFYHLQKQNLDATEKWLSYVKNPSSQLIKSQEAYFYYMKGLLMTQKQEKGTLKEGEILLKKALNLGLKQKHDIAAAKLNLAMAAMAKGRKREAETLLQEAKKNDTSNMLTDQIKLMREQMKRVNVGRNIQNPMMRNRGKF
ncbi:MAG: DUF2892 domain-containing protein [Flavobacteriales bacterium]